MLGLDSGTAADSESEGIWAMMATARAERGRGARARHDIISSESSLAWKGTHITLDGMEWKERGREGRRTTRRQARSVVEGEVETAAQRQTRFFHNLL